MLSKLTDDAVPEDVDEEEGGKEEEKDNINFKNK